MRKKISVIGEGVKVDGGLARFLGDLPGADVVVLGGDVDQAADQICVRAPAATVLVTGDDLAGRCKRLYELTLFPRNRIIGVPGDVEPVLKSILGELDDEHQVVAMQNGDFRPVTARVGHRGIVALP